MKFLKTAFLVVAYSIISCSDDVETTNTTTYNGIFVLNEGSFGNSNSSLTFLSNDYSQLTLDIFGTANSNQLMGDVAQSLLFQGDKAYIVINNSNKILIINRFTAQKVGEITSGLINPRYVIVHNNYLYISCWGVGSNPNDDYIAVVNVNDLNNLPKITVVEGPEKLLIHNNNLYVAHKGGFGNGNSISVINTNTKAVSSTFTTGDIPSEMAIFNNLLYVFCSGKVVYDSNWNIISETGGKIISYNLSDNSQNQSINFNNTQHPSNFCTASNEIFYALNNKIYKKTFQESTLPSIEFINPQVTYLYGLALKNNQIFVCDAKNFSTSGSLKIYNNSGNFITEKPTGIAPNGVYFN